MRHEMDAAYGSVLREEGISYREIGIELARRESRKVPYTACAVQAAIKRHRKILQEDSSDAF